MSATRVLDSFAVLAFLQDEPGAPTVAGLLKQARDRGKPLLMSVVNWGEVFYLVYRRGGRELAENAMTRLDALPIEVVEADQGLAMTAGEFKATRRMSYADCFAAALAKRAKAQLVTGDPEFKAVEDAIKIAWI